MSFLEAFEDVSSRIDLAYMMAHLQRRLKTMEAQVDGIGDPVRWFFVTSDDGGYVVCLALFGAFREGKHRGGSHSNAEYLWVDREFPDLSPNGGFCESVAYLISLLAGSFGEKRGPHPNNVDPTTYSH